MLPHTPFSTFGRQLVLGAMLLTLASAATAGATLDRIRVTGKVVLGHRESSVPFSYLDADKRPVGYALELCLKLVDAVKKKLELKTLNVEYLLVTSSNRIGFVEEGKVDMECGSTTNNAERRNKVAFTVPHYITGARYMVRSDETATDIVGMEGKRVVSTKGSTAVKAVERINRERVLRLTRQEAPDHARSVEMVEKNEADAFAIVCAHILRTRRQPRAEPAVTQEGQLEPGRAGRQRQWAKLALGADALSGCAEVSLTREPPAIALVCPALP